MNALELIILPDVDDAEFAEVLVDGAVAGHPYRFLLDTGAARTTLHHDAHTAVFPSIGTHRGSAVFSSFKEEHLIVVPELILGPLVKAEVIVVRTAEQSCAPRPLIGMDLLKDHCLSFQFHQQRAWVDVPDLTGAASADQTLWLDAAFHPYVPVHFGVCGAQAVWDTGAGITITDLNFVRRHPELFEPIGSSTGTDATGASMATPMFLMASTVIGKVNFPSQRVAGVDLSAANATLEVPMDLILGFNTLNQADWVFDFPRRRWGVTQGLETLRAFGESSIQDVG